MSAQEQPEPENIPSQGQARSDDGEVTEDEAEEKSSEGCQLEPLEAAKKQVLEGYEAHIKKLDDLMKTARETEDKAQQGARELLQECQEKLFTMQEEMDKAMTPMREEIFKQQEELKEYSKLFAPTLINKKMTRPRIPKKGTLIDNKWGTKLEQMCVPKIYTVKVGKIGTVDDEGKVKIPKTIQNWSEKLQCNLDIQFQEAQMALARDQAAEQKGAPDAPAQEVRDLGLNPTARACRKGQSCNYGLGCRYKHSEEEVKIMVAEAQLEKQAVEPATKGTKQKTPQTRRGDKQKAPPSKKAKQEAEELKRFEAFYAQKKAQEKAEETLRKNALEKRKVPKVGGKGGKGGEVGQAAKPADNPKAKAPTAVQQAQIMAQEEK